MTTMNETIRSGGILPVVAIDKIEYAVPLAKAIVDKDGNRTKVERKKKPIS